MRGLATVSILPTRASVTALATLSMRRAPWDTSRCPGSIARGSRFQAWGLDGLELARGGMEPNGVGVGGEVVVEDRGQELWVLLGQGASVLGRDVEEGGEGGQSVGPKTVLSGWL